MRNIKPNYHGHTPDELGSFFYATGALPFIEKHRTLSPADQLDITATARSVGAIMLRADQSQDGHLAANKSGWIIRIANDVPAHAVPFVFGHELGHIFLYEYKLQLGDTALQAFITRERQDKDHHDYVESFCDYFAGKLLNLDYPQELPDDPVVIDQTPEQLHLFNVVTETAVLR